MEYFNLTRGRITPAPPSMSGLQLNVAYVDKDGKLKFNGIVEDYSNIVPIFFSPDLGQGKLFNYICLGLEGSNEAKAKSIIKELGITWSKEDEELYRNFSFNSRYIYFDKEAIVSNPKLKYFENLNIVLFLLDGMNKEKVDLDLTREYQEKFAVYTNRDFPYTLAAYGDSIKTMAKRLLNEAHTKTPLDKFQSEAILEISSFMSIGIEYELPFGFLTNIEMASCGVLPLKDGSLKRPDKISRSHEIYGIEYTTVPLINAKEIRNGIINACEAIKVRSGYNTSASLHIHAKPKIEGINLKLTVPVLFKLGQLVQDDLFLHFPEYKSNPSLAGLQKNYCQKYFTDYSPINVKMFTHSDLEKFKNSVEYTAAKFFARYNNVSLNSEYNFSNGRHPAGDRKWDQHNRYYWLNILPLMFNKPNAKTLELRISPMTDNPDKVLAMALFLKALLKVGLSAETEKLVVSHKLTNSILNEFRTVENILSKGIDNEYVRGVVINYFRQRKQKSYTKDPLGKLEDLITVEK